MRSSPTRTRTPRSGLTPHRSSLTAALVLLLAGCSDTTLYRAGSDYFPLTQGSRWTYAEGAVTLIDSVAGDSSVAERNATVVLRSFAPEFWVRDQTGLWRFERRTTIRSGTEYELEARYALQYQLPLVLGATWSESFRDTVVVLGTETLLVRDSLHGSVVAIEDVVTPAGTFDDCYRVELFRSVQAETLAEANSVEWLAPGVGLVKRLTGPDSLVLLDCRISP
jgi:hypothetical protein